MAELDGLYSLETEIVDIPRRLGAISELMQVWSSNKGLTMQQTSVLTTLLNDAEDGAKRLERKFEAAFE